MTIYTCTNFERSNRLDPPATVTTGGGVPTSVASMNEKSVADGNVVL